MFGAQCPDCRINNKRVDTMLPWALDDTQPLPPILRFNKAIGSDRITSIPDTVSIRSPGSQNLIVYELLAVTYGSGSHFTCDIRSNIDEGSRVFTHYDGFHLRTDRVLLLSNDQPACNGGRPQFLPRHTEHVRDMFHRFTHISHVASVVYGRIASHQNDSMPSPMNIRAASTSSSNSSQRPTSQNRQAPAKPRPRRIGSDDVSSRQKSSAAPHADAKPGSYPKPTSSKAKKKKPCQTACECCTTCPHCKRRLATTAASGLRRHFKTCKKLPTRDDGLNPANQIPVPSAAYASGANVAANAPILGSPTAMTFAQTVARAAMTATSTIMSDNTNMT
jgi:hypothetical protein